MALLCYAIFVIVVLADVLYLVGGIPLQRDAVYARSKRSDAVAFSGATAGSGGNIPIPFQAIASRIARGDFSNLHFDFEPPNIPGAQVVSRFGEGEGESVSVSGRAQGPNGAFSSTSAGADSSGKVNYSVKTGKY